MYLYKLNTTMLQSLQIHNTVCFSLHMLHNLYKELIVYNFHTQQIT